MTTGISLKKITQSDDILISEQKNAETEVNWEMDRDTIIFFDKLGFGWVLDSMTVKEMNLCDLKEGDIVNKSLIKIIENLLENPGA
ncbi:MAG: hypothetical protein IMF02_02600 [Proteobacteria bacterium]|nr:hypothetical protein [Pseudomonadota bacterium]